MWQALRRFFQHNFGLCIIAGIALFLAFPPFYIIPTILFVPLFFHRIASKSPSGKSAFWYGYWFSFIVQLGGFYWVTYVIHVFGNVPWVVAGIGFLGFCLIGAVNLPIACWAIHHCYRRFKVDSLPSPWPELWYAFAFPAIFTCVELLIPKLFPWSLGHCLFTVPWLIQLSELTGSLVLTFALYSLGSVLGFLWTTRGQRMKPNYAVLFSVPGILWIINLSFGAYRISQGLPENKFQVALIQANIGNLDKVASRHGAQDKVQQVIDTYVRLTNKAMQSQPKPDLIVWPETAMPFELQNESRPRVQEIRTRVKNWNVPLITGGYAVDPLNTSRVYNAAYLFEPILPQLRMDLYHKNILLAFGEYMPLGETFPWLYQQFPEVSDFERGKTQNAFSLKNGLRLGITVCYEAIVPSFYRKVVANEVNAVINLTNDSWFGPTTEPYLHGALTIFRAVESRVPLVRVTNTGTSFTVDVLGRMSRLTPVWEEDVLNEEIRVPADRPLTWYTRFGDWFGYCLGAIVLVFLVISSRKKHASLPL